MKCINMKNVIFLFAISFFFSCSNDLESTEDTLENDVKGKEVVLDNVIACAASGEISNLISVFLYPRSGASNFKCFVTESVDQDKNNFSNYKEFPASLSNVFNGYLLKFDAFFENEKWIIVSFEEDNKVHLSNPIRLKHLSKVTQYLPENVSIDTSSEMPIFTWEDGDYTDSKIYFQVVSSAENNLISGTYTYDKMFQFYKLDNVVLNVTRNSPLELEKNMNYVFTLMGVSEDNWVNLFVVKPFIIQN